MARRAVYLHGAAGAGGGVHHAPGTPRRDRVGLPRLQPWTRRGRHHPRPGIYMLSQGPTGSAPGTASVYAKCACGRGTLTDHTDHRPPALAIFVCAGFSYFFVSSSAQTQSDDLFVFFLSRGDVSRSARLRFVLRSRCTGHSTSSVGSCATSRSRPPAALTQCEIVSELSCARRVCACGPALCAMRCARLTA